jgi:hypothetical protein
MLRNERTPRKTIKPVRRLLLKKDGARKPTSPLKPPTGVLNPPFTPKPPS